VNAAQPAACSSLAQWQSAQINSTSPGIPPRIVEGSQPRRKAETDVVVYGPGSGDGFGSSHASKLIGNPSSV
jgi:hypothetical protein